MFIPNTIVCKVFKTDRTNLLNVPQELLRLTIAVRGLVSLTHPDYFEARYQGLTSCTCICFQALLGGYLRFFPFGIEKTCLPVNALRLHLS